MYSLHLFTAEHITRLILVAIATYLTLNYKN